MAETAEQRAERRKKDWVFDGITHRVTPEVYQLITTPYRGQSNLGKKQTQVLSKIFTEECVLKDPVLPGVEISSNLLYTRIVCKFDTSYKKVLKNGQINDVLWNDGLRGSYLSLETYYVVPQAGELVPEGAWTYLKKSAANVEDT